METQKNTKVLYPSLERVVGLGIRVSDKKKPKYEDFSFNPQEISCENYCNILSDSQLVPVRMCKVGTERFDSLRKVYHDVSYQMNQRLEQLDKDLDK